MTLTITAGSKTQQFTGDSVPWDAMMWLNSDVPLSNEKSDELTEWMNKQGSSSGSTFQAKKDLYALAILGWYESQKLVQFECYQMFVVGPSHDGGEPEKLLADAGGQRQTDDRWFTPGVMVVQNNKPYLDIGSKFAAQSEGTQRIIGELWTFDAASHGSVLAAFDAAQGLGEINGRELVIVEGAMTSVRTPAWCYTVTDGSKLSGAEPVAGGSWRTYLRNQLKNDTRRNPFNG